VITLLRQLARAALGRHRRDRRIDALASEVVRLQRDVATLSHRADDVDSELDAALIEVRGLRARVAEIEQVTARLRPSALGPAGRRDPPDVARDVGEEPSEAGAGLSGAAERPRRCTHEGIGLPGCVVCDPRTKSQGGPQPDREAP
jgi:hypothetical protein